MSSSAVREPVAVSTLPPSRVPTAADADAPAASGRFALRLPREAWPFLLLMLVGLALRVWLLGDRAEHHDESMHALFSYDLYQGKGFRHDPILHGTFLFIQNALVYWLFGASDFTSRLAPVLHGVAVVGMPYFLRDRRYLGRLGAIAASAFLCLSPCFLYYSRFIREDIFAASLQFAAAICIVRYFEEQRPKYLYVMAGALAFSFTDKENTYMTAAIFAAFAGMWLAWRGIEAVRRGGSLKAGLPGPALDIFIVLCTLVAPLGTAMLVMFEKVAKLNPGTLNNDTLLAVVLMLLFAASAIVGLRWRAGVWITCAIIFWGIFGTMFTTLFTNPVGFWTGIIESLRYWLAQQDVHRGEQPTHYYMVLLSLYEYLPIALGAFGAWIALRDGHRFGLFSLWWAVTAFGFYTWAAEKMPWLSLHMALPIILLGSLALGRFLEGVEWRELWRGRALVLGGLILVAFAIMAGLQNLGFPWADLARPLEGQRRVLQYAGMAIAFIFVVVYAANLGSNLGLRGGLQTVGLTLLAVASLFYVRASFMASYQFGDIPREVLIYTQSSPDVTAVMREIDRLNHRTGQGTNFKVAYDSGVSWPFEWYLRNQKGRVFYGDGLPPKDAGVVLVSFENYSSSGITREEAARQALGSDYVSTRYRLRWWFPEKYRQLGLSNLIPTIMNEQNRAELWRFLIYREIEPLDSTDFSMFVRKDLLADLGGPITPSAGGATTGQPPAAAAGQQQVAQAPAQPPVEQPTKVQAIQSIGTTGNGDGQLSDPKGVAVAPDGSIWVADTGNSRIVKFGPDGSFQLKIGSKGDGPGQFNEPWGIAVGPDGNVYVADTWNHRIVKLGPDGTFIKMWGEVVDTRGLAIGAENGFYGPRGIAFAKDGTLLITDAGNKRIVRDSPDGQYLAQYGGRGSDPGKFEEQIGIATDRDGNVYIADAWNHRIQKFSPDMVPVAQWPVSGWRSQGVPHKPYIAVDAQGRVYITDPESSRVQAFSPEGQVIQTWGGIGRDMASLTLPTGIAADNQGRIWVADAGNGRILAFPAPGPRG